MRKLRRAAAEKRYGEGLGHVRRQQKVPIVPSSQTRLTKAQERADGLPVRRARNVKVIIK
jgi:hypothetical protein